MSVLAPQRIVVEDLSVDGEDGSIGLHLPPCTIGSVALTQKFRTLFHKLRQLRLLYRPTRPLCKHEVAALEASALSFGHWFPVNFPDSSITPKVHWLITHIPDIARRFWSSGQTTEQVIESFHANLNSYGRSYACIQNTQRRFAAMTKNHWARIWQGRQRARLPLRETES